jgi:4-amino-4-deoxy-L-arabinose transferase-like glycosyltransferase
MGTPDRVKTTATTVLASRTAAAGAFVATAWHLARNAAPPAFDDAWYLETSFRLWTALKSGPLSFIHAYENAFRIKAPLISLVPLPLYAVFGPGERIAVWANLPLAVLAAWAWSRAAAEWWRGHPRAKEAAALAGALCALTPLAYGLSRVFLVETLLSALLGLWAWRCAAAKPDDRNEGWRLGVLLGLGLLAKVTFPLVAAGFAWPARARLEPHVKAALFIAVPLAATWYAVNFPYVLGFAWSAGFGHIASDYAGAGGLASRLASLARDGFSWPLAAAMGAVATAAAFFGREKPGAGLYSGLWGLAPILIYAASVNREVRLVSPLLPVFAILAGRAAIAFSRPMTRAISTTLLLGTGLLVCADQTFRAGPKTSLAYNGAPSTDAGWDRAALVNAAERAGGRGTVAAIALEHPRLNANNLSSLAASRGWTMSFVNLGYAQTSAEAALIRLKDKDASVIVLVDGLSDKDLPAFLNRANAGVAATISSGRLPARETERIPLAPGIFARVFRLTR